MKSATRIIVSKFFLLTLVLTNLSCSHIGMKYTADYQSDLSGPGQVVAEKSYPVRWLAILCGGTFWAYGGACWGYLAYPTDSMITEIKQNALGKLGSQAPDYQLSKESLDPYQWKFFYENARVINGDDYQKIKNQEQQAANNSTRSYAHETKSFDIKSFESNIVSKPSEKELLYSEADDFPMGWPEKWYFESPEYRYWTIVGDIKENQSTAMASSATKIQEILSREFPQKNYKETPNFETTHNHVKKINGKYQSWRIVRVLHRDVTRLTR